MCGKDESEWGREVSRVAEKGDADCDKQMWTKRCGKREWRVTMSGGTMVSGVYSQSHYCASLPKGSCMHAIEQCSNRAIVTGLECKSPHPRS